jgi:TonB family protein
MLGACIGCLQGGVALRAAAATLPPARVSAACSNRQPPVDLSRFAGTTAHIVHPRIAYRAFPNYPASLITQAVHGLVSICVLVDEHGQPAKPTILYSSGSHALDTAALRAARATTFRPGTINGTPVTMPTELDYRFDSR